VHLSVCLCTFVRACITHELDWLLRTNLLWGYVVTMLLWRFTQQVPWQQGRNIDLFNIPGYTLTEFIKWQIFFLRVKRFYVVTALVFQLINPFFKIWYEHYGFLRPLKHRTFYFHCWWLIVSESYFLTSYNQYLMTKWLTQELVKWELFKFGRGLTWVTTPAIA
jgi:hypothetical protein